MFPSNSTPQYSVLRDSSGDIEDRDASLHDPLLITDISPNISSASSRSCSITLNPVLTIRLASTICCITSFVYLVLVGQVDFIAADIFLALLILFNVIMILHHLVHSTFRVTIEFRGRQHDLGGKTPPRFAIYLDVLITLVLCICLVAESVVASHDSWRWRYSRPSWVAGAVVGYIAVCLQCFLVIPGLGKKTLKLSATVNTARTVKLDLKTPANQGTGQDRTARRDVVTAVQPQSVEDLV